MLKYTLRGFKLSPGENLRKTLIQKLGLKDKELLHLEVIKISVDARKSPPKLVYNLKVELAKKPRFPRDIRVEEGWSKPLSFEILKVKKHPKIVIVGFGPAGMFASYALSLAGVRHTVIERGKKLEERERDVTRLMEEGVLDEDSNVLFGEGGAGAFSDGKLTTRIRSPYVEVFKKVIVDLGVPREKLLWSRPHIGTEGVRRLTRALREKVEERGVEVRFSEKLIDIEVREGRVRGVFTNMGYYPCDMLILATGHSARDVYELLRKKGVKMEKKVFAVGVRVEHPKNYIDKLFYKEPKGLPPAEYQLSVRRGERGIYTFCMCPGGYVINASSEREGLNINGMSMERRDGDFSNSAVVVNVFPNDIRNEDPLSGIEFQRYWERKAYSVAKGFVAPCQNLIDFMEGSEPKRSVSSTYKPGVCPFPLWEVLPMWVVEHLRYGFMEFDRRFKGFVTEFASLTAPEMRTSSPVRIPRNEKGESISLKGLFPVGEGSGYAGGIVSSAADAMKIVDKNLNLFSFT